MHWMRALLLLLMLGLPLAPAWPVQPDEVLPDAGLEARARSLSKELRCMVCQNQSIDDSDAPLARDLRVLIREHLKGGDSDQQIIDFLRARYGDFVLLRPRFSLQTAILWLTPLGALIIGVVALVLVWRRRADGEANLSPQEEARLAEILQRDDA